MFGEFRSRRPNKNFSLLYLESNEVHFLSLKVSLLDENCTEQIEGRLHLCSRSIIYQPKAITRPLLRFKYSCGLFMRMLKNIETKKALRLSHLRKAEHQIKTAMGRGSVGILDLLEDDGKKNQSKSPGNYEGKKSEALRHKKIQSEEKICNCLFIKVSNISVIQRKPISPYITEKSDDNIIFLINKVNPRTKILRFLKLYDELLKTTDQDKINKSIIAATCEESAEDLLEKYQEEGLETSSILRCRRVIIEGCEYGHVILLKSKVMFYPLVNCPDHEVIQFTHREIKFILRYRYMMQHTGVQIWLYNLPYSILFVFADRSTAESVYTTLCGKGEKIMDIKLETITEMWASGQISNVHYLNYVNMLASRSHNDLSQYPIFPWIIHNYDADFDLGDPDIFRDLTKPVGALNKHRLRKLKDLHEVKQKSRNEDFPSHLYPTHYSTPSFTSYYLIRKIPEFIVRLQAGVFIPAERIFRCVESAYMSSLNSIADYKELIPEFYSTECDFLINSGKLDMGSTPENQLIDDVVLPKWATNAQDFLLKMRAAFESDYVSARINDWIDLVFGYKQSGTAASNADNLFYFLTYEENIDFDRPISRIERMSLEVQVGEFGQTPIRLFEEKHSIRKARILNLDADAPIEDKKVATAKIRALTNEKERLQEQIQRQIYKFNKKMTEKEQILIRNQNEKKKEMEKMRAIISIDTESLRKFDFKKQFSSEKEKDTYIRQIEQLLKNRELENEKMSLVIAGLRRQINEDEESIHSQIEENVRIETDFLADDEDH